MTITRFLRAVLGLAGVGFALALGSGVAFAAGDGSHGVDVKTLGLQILNLGVLLFILIKFAGGAVRKALKARHEQFKTDMDDAARVKATAEEHFRAHERRLSNLENEIAAMREAARKEAQVESARIIASAEEKAKRVSEETKFQLEQQVKEAEHRFRNEVARAAVAQATLVLKQAVAPADEQRLAQSFVADLNAPNAPHAEGKPTRPASQNEVVS